MLAGGIICSACAIRALHVLSRVGEYDVVGVVINVYNVVVPRQQLHRRS